MASNITVDTLTKGSTTLNTDEIVDTNSSQVCKAWVNFNGTGTVAIRDSHNVSSITDAGVGAYYMNFSTPFSDSNYSVVGSTSQNMWLAIRSNVDSTYYAYLMSLYNVNTASDAAKVYAQVFSN